MRAIALMGLMMVGSGVWAGVAHAQQATPVTNPPRPPASDPPNQFLGAGPDACVYVPFYMDPFVTKGKPDPLGYAPERDVATPQSVSAVRRCAEAYGGASVNAWQWLSVARAQLALGNDAAAKAINDKALAFVAHASIEQRAWVLHLIAMDYANAQPARIAEAKAALAMLDVLGTPAFPGRVKAHAAVAWAAARQWDDALAVHECDATIAAYRELSNTARVQMAKTVIAPFFQKAEIALRRENGDRARTILDSALALLPRGSSPWGEIKRRRDMYALVGTRGAPLEAEHWFHRADTAAVPARGVVTLLGEVTHYCTRCEARYQALQRLERRFAGKPFVLVSFTQTSGFFGDSAPMPPAPEARLDSNYFYGYVKLPGALAVYETKYTFDIDTRRVDQPGPQAVHYRDASFIVTDKEGVIRYIGNIADVLDEPIARFIEQLLKE